MENKMNEVAKLFGLELEEEFEIEGYHGKFKLIENGLLYQSYNKMPWSASGGILNLLTGENKIIKLSKQILDEKEREYLSNIIKPFRDKIVWIKKVDSPTLNYEYIKICYQDNIYTIVLNFPDFKVNTMYKGMKTNKEYTLEKLDL